MTMTVVKPKYVWQYLNWFTLMENIVFAQRFNSNEVYLRNKAGDTHKVYIKYLNPFVGDETNLFEIKINDVDMGGKVRDVGEAYDLIMEAIEQ